MSNKNLSLNERIIIEKLLDEKLSITEIGSRIKRHKSTISRELRRNSWNQCNYLSWYAELKYTKRKTERRKPTKSTSLVLHNRIRKYLEFGYNPDCICQRLKLENKPIGVSHETIYQIVYRDYINGGDLHSLMPLKRKKRKLRIYSGRKRNDLKGIRPLSERPKSVLNLANKLHWEADPVVGSHHKNHFLNFIERKTKYFCSRKLGKKDSWRVKNAFLYLSRKFRMLTTTVDQGKEFAKHKEIEKNGGPKLYFCDKGSPWQKGMIENANRIFRRHLPKNKKINDLTQIDLNQVARKINNIPRKSLEYKTPFETYWGLNVLQS